MSNSKHTKKAPSILDLLQAALATVIFCWFIKKTLAVMVPTIIEMVEYPAIFIRVITFHDPRAIGILAVFLLDLFAFYALWRIFRWLRSR